MSLFDGYKKQAMVTVTGTMGRPGTWIPSDGSVPAGITADVLFKMPTEMERLNGVEYTPERPRIEYHKDSFPGMVEAARNGDTEHITIDSVKYLVEGGSAKWDGDLIRVYLVKSEQI